MIFASAIVPVTLATPIPVAAGVTVEQRGALAPACWEELQDRWKKSVTTTAIMSGRWTRHCVRSRKDRVGISLRVQLVNVMVTAFVPKKKGYAISHVLTTPKVIIVKDARMVTSAIR